MKKTIQNFKKKKILNSKTSGIIIIIPKSFKLYFEYLINFIVYIPIPTTIIFTITITNERDN